MEVMGVAMEEAMAITAETVVAMVAAMVAETVETVEEDGKQPYHTHAGIIHRKVVFLHIVPLRVVLSQLNHTT